MTRFAAPDRRTWSITARARSTVAPPSAGFRSMLAMAPTRPAASSASPRVGGAARVRAPFDAFSLARFTWARVRSATRPRPVVVRSIVSSCINTRGPSLVRTASSSRIALGMARPVASMAAMEFSGWSGAETARCAEIATPPSRTQSK